MAQNDNDITYFAETNSRGKPIPFGIKRKDRARHVYVIGKTGVGKSTMLENMAIQDIRNGEGIAFIDPHGSTADRIMEYVPKHRIKDVVYFAPFDMEHPVAFNIMEDVGYDKRHLVVSGLITAFKKLWVDSFSARMEYILSNTLLALLEYPGATLIDVNRMLVNKKFRAKVVDNVKDPMVKDFWLGEFANYSDRYTQEATPAIQNKVGQFTSNPLIRNIIGQPKSSFDIRQMMDDKKILIMNLSKGRVGEVNAQLLGSMLVTKIYLAAMSRADVNAAAMKELPHFYFYVDEFQNFANESFADILSEARKYKLNLTIAHQYVEQMEEEVRDAVFGNVGTTIAFRVGPFDAEALEPIFAPQFLAADLVNLGVAQIYLTLMIDGTGSPPFSASTLPPFDPTPESFVPEVLSMSRKQFARPRVEVEQAVADWYATDTLEAPEPKPKKDYSTGSGNHAASQSKNVNSVSYGTASPQHKAERVEKVERVEHHTEHHVERPADVAELQPVVVVEQRAPEPVYIERPAHTQVEQPAQRPAEKPSEKYVVHQTREVRTYTQPTKPPLEGTGSLKEALAMVTASKAPIVRTATTTTTHTGPGKSGGVHAPDLKHTLSQIIAPEHKQEQRQEQKQEHTTKTTTTVRTPAGLPDSVLKEMLEVEPDLPDVPERMA
ncbi:MAG: hypothetical protein JWO43_404 [Candidatus Adlerbacteria bacterium]|nr:hypothetical protein [Candidatus Adlerbacteria bacterium]